MQLSWVIVIFFLILYVLVIIAPFINNSQPWCPRQRRKSKNTYTYPLWSSPRLFRLEDFSTLWGVGPHHCACVCMQWVKALCHSFIIAFKSLARFRCVHRGCCYRGLHLPHLPHYDSKVPVLECICISICLRSWYLFLKFSASVSHYSLLIACWLFTTNDELSEEQT